MKDSHQCLDAQVDATMALVFSPKLSQTSQAIQERVSGGSQLTSRNVFRKEITILRISCHLVSIVDLCSPLESNPTAVSVGTRIGQRVLTSDSREAEGAV